MGCIGGMIFGIVQFAALVLIAVGVPLGMMQPQNRTKFEIKNTYCVSMWGVREKCLQTATAYTPKGVWEHCDGRVSRFKAAQVCAIVGLIIFAASFVLSFLLSCCCPCIRYICLVLNFAGMIVITVCWGCMLDCYLRDMGSYNLTETSGDVCVKLKNFHGETGAYLDGMKLGSGFILILVGWALGLLNVFVLLIPC